MTTDVTIRTKYADGRIKEEIHTIEGGKVVARKKVTRVKSDTVAVDYPEEKVEAYCMKCKEKVEAKDVKKVAVSGKNAIRGLCPKCGSKVFKFTGGTVTTGAKKTRAKKTTNPAKLKLSRKAQSAWTRLQKAGVLEDCWCGQLKSGSAIWWEGSAAEGWRLCMDDIAESEMPEFKRFVLKSL